ncbi:LysM peptidoglycan-binding domain-containing protein [Martelella limonii]|uniref:LysM peptidoglycan-binding domain-containing protein n=1 Tax=Martelella limonii TaxID=1647649 RepID=UPI0015802B1D|nr:LysM peptidoglycan-binding domain-containing protein [Martelella limonii]
MKSKRTGIVIAVILLVLIAAGLFFVAREGEKGTDAGEQAQQSQADEQPDVATDGPSSDSDSSSDPKSARLRIPTFDVLRVDPDGTVVIAGAAEPLGTLSVKEGDAVITSSEVDSSGDFVAIVETPLKPGDHLIYLDVTMPDGRTARSLQTATISIPETPDGELLALITEPGKASELVAVPDEDPDAAKGSVVAVNRSASSDDDGTAGADEKTARENAEASTQGNTGGASAQQDGNASGMQNDGDETRLPTIVVETGADDNQQASEDRQTDDGSSQIVALVSIKAVEIEGARLFVAGEGDPGATIRGYIDDTLIGDAKVNIEGNYVLDAEIDVSIGLHTIRVDMLARDGGVIARAVVPFDRPAGDQVAAISSAPATAGEEQEDGFQTFTQPQLEGSDNAVIIRRGDNLWRISRRMYGRGVRYTTIYIANEQQIVNPNVILPGQVFSVPKEPMPIGEAETIHRRLLQGEKVGPEYGLPAADR